MSLTHAPHLQSTAADQPELAAAPAAPARGRGRRSLGRGSRRGDGRRSRRVGAQGLSSRPQPRKRLGAAKAAFDGLSNLTESAKSTAKFATLIDSTVGDNVAKVVPGLNIATAGLSVASNAMTLADKSMRMNETNTAMLEARAADTSDKRVNVLVYPLLRVTQRYTKNLEQTSWSTAVAISEVVTSIATVASAGGFGIPSAVQQGIGVLDKLHSLGHFIAEAYLTHLSQKASEASVGALEGSAEELLSRNPGTAVDGIILRAAQMDPHVVAFLSNDEVDGVAVDAAIGSRGSLPRQVSAADASSPGSCTSSCRLRAAAPLLAVRGGGSTGRSRSQLRRARATAGRRRRPSRRR